MGNIVSFKGALVSGWAGSVCSAHSFAHSDGRTLYTDDWKVAFWKSSATVTRQGARFSVRTPRQVYVLYKGGPRLRMADELTNVL